MSTVNSTSGTNSAELFNKIAGPAQKKTETNTASELEGRFLTLLMSQIKNQDPLNPLDNAQVTSQLAQLNTVTGIEKLNGTLSQLLDGYAEAQGMQAAQVIGKNVMVAGNTLPLAGGNAFGGIKLEGNADQVTVTIKEASGRVVQTQELGAHPAGSFYFAWDGKDAAGNTIPDGDYTFSATASAAGQKIAADTAQIGTVSAVVREKNGFLLDLGSLGQFAFKDVQQIL
jgi:flagellar basal-body rod modification protein FlgD